jgi:chemotaxis protein MotB
MQRPSRSTERQGRLLENSTASARQRLRRAFYSRNIGRVSGLVGIVAIVGSSGCFVEKDKYVQALADLSYTRNQLIAEHQRVLAAQAEVTALQAAMQDRDAKLNEDTAAKADLIRKLDEVAVLNAALQERLQKAGQSVESLANEKGSLAAALEDTRKRLEELRRSQAAAEARAAQFQELIRRFEKLAEAGKLKVVLREGRMIIELPNDVLFDSAHAELKDEGKTTLNEVAKVLKTLPDRRFQIAGHTDNVKISTSKYPSNWELSTARAITVTRLFVDDGVDPKNLSAAGYGEFDPVAPNDSPESKAKNRRIEITLVPNLDEFVRPTGAPQTPPTPAALKTPQVAEPTKPKPPTK